MQTRNTPSIDTGYWVAISIASIFGANCGDFVSKVLHMGHWRGLLPVALGLIVVLWLERRSKTATTAYYWLAIILVRTAATNLADLSTHDFKLRFGMVIAGLAALLAGVVAIDRVSAQTASRPGLPATNSRYWIAMLIAGTLGTAAGDGLVDVLHIGLPTASAIMVAVLAAVLALREQPIFAAPAFYWIAIVVVRTAGTNVGDLSAHTIGLALSTGLSGALFVATLLLWQKRRDVALQRDRSGLLLPARENS